MWQAALDILLLSDNLDFTYKFTYYAGKGVCYDCGHLWPYWQW